MNSYESILIVKQSLSDEGIEKVVERYKTLIAQKGGAVLTVENMGKRKLVSNNLKEQKGVFVAIHFQLAGEAIEELDRTYRLDDDVIRQQMIRLTRKNLAQREAKEKLKESEEKGEAPAQELSRTQSS